MDYRRGFRRAFGKLFGSYDYSTHIFAFHQYQAIYFAVPKCANSSVKNAIWNLMPPEVQNATKNTDRPRSIYPGQRDRLFRKKVRLMKHEVDKYSNYFMFTFVRNPWDRLVSCYTDKIESGSLVESGRRRWKAERALFKEGRFQEQMPFDEFVREVAQTPDNKSNRHFRSQHTFLTDRKGVLLPSFLGRFENLTEDFQEAMNRIGAPEVSLPHVRRSEHRDYRDYYTPALRSLVEQRYEKDIRLFGYEF